MMNSSMDTRHTPVVRRRSFNMKVDECLILCHHIEEELVIIAHVIIPTAKGVGMIQFVEVKFVIVAVFVHIFFLI